MKRLSQHFFFTAAVGLTVLFAGFVPAAGKKDPPGTSAVMGQLRALFKQWDTNGDGYLDKDELAKAFGYSKPYDYKPDAKPSEADKDANGDNSKAKDDDKPAKKPDYSDRPDYLFLTQLDQNNDEKISYDEFQNWARTYAVGLKKLNDALTRITKAEAKLDQAVTKEARKKLESELKAQRKIVADYNKEARAFDSQIQKVMKRLGK